MALGLDQALYLLEAGPWVKAILRTHCVLSGSQEGVVPDVMQTQ